MTFIVMAWVPESVTFDWLRLSAAKALAPGIIKTTDARVMTTARERQDEWFIDILYNF